AVQQAARGTPESAFQKMTRKLALDAVAAHRGPVNVRPFGFVALRQAFGCHHMVFNVVVYWIGFVATSRSWTSSTVAASMSHRCSKFQVRHRPASDVRVVSGS